MKQRLKMREGALDGAEAFLAVARHLSFTRAAAELGVSPSAVGQSVRALETRLGTALFLRSTRSVGLSEAGARFFARVGPAYEEIRAAADDIHDLAGRPTGRLKVAISRGAGAVFLRPLVASFCARFPGIELEIAASEHPVDLARDGFDAAIRFGELVAPDMVAARLTPPFRMLAVASPAYFAERSPPTVPSDLRGHRCLRLRRGDGSVAPWRFVEAGREIEVEVDGPLIAHDYPTLRDAAIDGLGIAVAPEPILRNPLDAGALVAALEDLSPSLPGLFLCYLDRRQATPKLRAFIDHLRGRPIAGV